MASLGRPESLPYVEESDLVSLAADLGPGLFPSADLYGWYVKTIARDGRKPVTAKRFGMALREAKWQDATQKIDGRMTRCWRITNPWARRGDAMMAEELAAERAEASR